MNQTHKSIYPISGPGVAEELNTCLEAGLHIAAIIDPLADNSLVPTFFNESSHLRYHVLFLQTSLEHVLAVSPYLVEIVDVQDAFCRYLLDHPNGWGFFAVSSMSLNGTTEHWKSLLRIHSDNEVTHFRFYDRQVMYSLWTRLNHADIAALLGPHFCLYLPPAQARYTEDPNEERTWTKFPHPSADDPQTIAGCYEPGESPWWTLRADHWAAFEDKRQGIMANNVKEFLFETYPAQAGAKHARENLGEYCLSQIHRAGTMGVTDQEAVKYFVACCLLYGGQFPEGFIITMPPAPNQRDALANELRGLCEKAVNNG